MLDKASQREQRFFSFLRGIFVGVPVEGKSGYANLSHIGSCYFEKIVEPGLREAIDAELERFPDFREELFEKLYTFFRGFFIEDGPAGFSLTPYHLGVYDRVYTGDRDVVLFWKASRFYYIKTDRLFRSVTVDVDGFRFYFDVSQLEHKRANEKRELVYVFKEILQDGTIVFMVYYLEGKVQTKIDDVRTDIRDALGLATDTNAVPSERTLRKAFRAFERRQKEVDYFLCKDCKGFLREQFDLWLWQHLLGKPGEEPPSELTEADLARLQAFKRIAYCVIDYISDFEDELVRIWNEPRAVKNSHYVITLDRIVDQPGGEVILEQLLSHPNIDVQLREWRELGMVDEGFRKEHIWEENLIDGKVLHHRYRYLPIDTRYFPDLEQSIVNLFENPDEALDGWLIKSENYQALNTILQRFCGKVKAIYIDPPYNTGVDEFSYLDKFNHSSWLSMIENRLLVARSLLSEDGVIFISVGDLNPQEGESYRLQMLASSIFPKRFGNLIWRKRSGIGSFSEKDMTENHEYILVYGKDASFLYHNILSDQKLSEFSESDDRGPYRWMGLLGPSQQTKERRPNLNYEVLVDPRSLQLIGFRYSTESGEIVDLRDTSWSREQLGEMIVIAPPGKSTWLISRDQMWKHAQAGLIQVRPTLKGGYELRIKNYLYDSEGALKGNVLKSLLSDNNIPVGTNADASREFSALFSELDVKQIKPKPVSLVQLLLRVSSTQGDLVMDFFAGSGTTAHAVVDLCRADKGHRRYILIEMGECFHRVLLPRVKKVVFSDKWKDGKAQPDGKGISHFVKYQELEQFDDVLLRGAMLGGNYVITLDRIVARLGGETILDRLLEHPNIDAQIQEWRELGMVDEKFQKEQIWEQNLVYGRMLNPRYCYLPIDTKYFPDLKPSIVALFDNLDDVLDGWLIKSENYQALNTILPKFRGKVQVIYADPPFNKDQNASYHYSVKYCDATWATLLENRLRLAKEMMAENGVIFVRCDYAGNWIIRGVMNQVFGRDNFRNEILVGRGASKAGLFSQFEKVRSLAVSYDVLYWYSKNSEARYRPFLVEASEQQRTTGRWTAFDKGEAYDRPTMRYEILGVNLQSGQWKWKKSRAEKAVQNYLKYLEVSKETGETLEEYWYRTGCKLEFIRKSETGKIQYWVEPRDTVLLDNNWLDIPGYSSTTGFQTENSEQLLKRILQTVSDERDLVMDFFLGSGTTIAVAHKLGRRWIGIEVGEHFYTVVLPRMKRVLFYDKLGISKEKDVRERYNERSAGGFFLYCEIEQFDDVLCLARTFSSLGGVNVSVW
jgi:adenine-specific DNA-methyltransferase